MQESDNRPSVDPETMAALDELQEPGEADFLADLIGAYLDEAPVRLAAIEGAIAARDMRMLARAAHVLKGSSANLGANTLSEHCKDLEIKAATDQHKALPIACERLRGEFENVRRELQAIVDGRKPRAG